MINLFVIISAHETKYFNCSSIFLAFVSCWISSLTATSCMFPGVRLLSLDLTLYICSLSLSFTFDRY